MSSITCFDGSKCLVRRLVVSIAFSWSNSWLSEELSDGCCSVREIWNEKGELLGEAQE